jgi:uncharacterized membrane protein
MQITWRTELPQWLLIAAMFVVAIAVWPIAPERMPVHWNIQGEVDGYGNKFVGLLLLPLVTLGLYGLLLGLPRLDPRYDNYARFSGTYTTIRLAMVVLLAALYGVTVLAALGYSVDVGAVVSLAIGGLFVLLGSVMHRIQPNWFVGIRTPWTLSSDLSWEKTHRVGGWLFLALGPLLALAGLLRSGWLLAAVIGITAASLIPLVAYSYWVYRQDPQRRRPLAS